MQTHVSAILLAAGSSRRMGQCKQLLPLDGRPAIVRCLESILAAGVAGITVVVGADGTEVELAIAHLPVTVVLNTIYGSDMAGSVLVGLQRVGHKTSGILVCLADHPLIEARTCRLLMEEHRRRPDAILIPTYQGRKGHPTLFPRTIIAELAFLPTLRDVIGRHANRVRFLEVDDPAIVEDMDTPADYRRLVARLAATL
ncbi:MAG TPA: nucleotidyltransferase family protein [Geobacteraceae bacterium]|nr:nucleotidyltransferase family protein [Geobacteraceae bacterium]